MEEVHNAAARFVRRPYMKRASVRSIVLRGAVVAVAAIGIMVRVGTAIAAPHGDTRCRAVHYSVSLEGAPPDALATVREAMRRVGRATGVPFVDDGNGNATLHVLWVGADGSQWRGLAEQVGFTADRPTASGTVGKVVYLNAGYDLPLGFADRRTWGGVLMHELGHAMGLQHAVGADEIMYPDLIRGPARWGVSDRRLLRAAGERAGCQ